LTPISTRSTTRSRSTLGKESTESSSNKTVSTNYLTLPIDRFSIDNYDYILKEHPFDEIKWAYEAAGPFDFIKGEEDDIEEERQVLDKFEIRKSGNQYRGQVNMGGKPDGKGFKVFPNGSVYEGFF
jgi:hypothetical protein